MRPIQAMKQSVAPAIERAVIDDIRARETAWIENKERIGDEVGQDHPP